MAPLHRAAAASQATQLIQHFIHPQHPLHHVHKCQEFNCGGCNTLGSGMRYHCPSCDFDLHEQCANSPFTLISPHLHPHHQLTLVNRPGKAHFCDLCGDIANGLFYTCQICDIDIHPLCSQLPANVQHAFHPQHLLALQPGIPNSWCNICRGGCSTWRYKCNTCDVNVHLNCVVAPPQVQAGQSAAPALVPQQTMMGYPYTCVTGNNGPMMNQPVTYQSQGSMNGRKNGSKLASSIGKFAVNAVVTSIIGVPLNFSSKK